MARVRHRTTEERGSVASASRKDRVAPRRLALAGLVMALCFAGMVLLGDLRERLIPFLILYALAAIAYVVAVWQVLARSLERHRLVLIVGMAALFRALLLFTSPPTLSTDLYRYIWDGRLVNAGVNPYAHAVDSPLLDPFHSNQRALVNHSWMASPYLPVAQGFFALVTWLVPGSPLAFQVAAAALDLITGVLVMDLLRRLGFPSERGLIYLWSPLVIVEFAHGAHVDGLMILLTTAALYALTVLRWKVVSAIVLAAATLTKGLPTLFLPVLGRRWRRRHVGLYLGIVVAACLPFGVTAGWGWVGPLDGEGLFGALRIYAAYWNFNSGVHHWLEVLLAGYPTAGGVLPEVAGPIPILAARLIVTVLLGLVLVVVWWKAREIDDDVSLLRLALIPPAAYLLLATTVHPWYVALLMPLLPFLSATGGSPSRAERFLVPALFFSIVVTLSYLAYSDLDTVREVAVVRWLEYVPLYGMLIWAAWPAISEIAAIARG